MSPIPFNSNLTQDVSYHITACAFFFDWRNNFVDGSNAVSVPRWSSGLHFRPLTNNGRFNFVGFVLSLVITSTLTVTTASSITKEKRDIVCRNPKSEYTKNHQDQANYR